MNKVRKAKATYYQRLLNDNHLNSCKFWNSIKSIFPVRSKKSSNFPNVSRERVNCFIDYFSSIVNEMKSVAFPFNRSQLVEINNITSDKPSIASGVPQGSILSPLMFIIFFNGLKDSISYCDIFQYTNDTVILFADNDVTKIENENASNKDMSSIDNYCKVNKLLLNLKKDKTEVMLFGTAQCLK